MEAGLFGALLGGVVNWRRRHWRPWPVPKFVTIRQMRRRSSGKCPWIERHMGRRGRRVIKFFGPSWIRLHHAQRWMRGALFPRAAWINPLEKP
jgi:hypothetical protein